MYIHVYSVGLKCGIKMFVIVFPSCYNQFEFIWLNTASASHHHPMLLPFIKPSPFAPLAHSDLSLGLYFIFHFSISDSFPSVFKQIKYESINYPRTVLHAGI